MYDCEHPYPLSIVSRPSSTTRSLRGGERHSTCETWFLLVSPYPRENLINDAHETPEKPD